MADESLVDAIETLRRLPISFEGLVKVEGLLMSEHAYQYYWAFFSAMIGEPSSPPEYSPGPAKPSM